MRRGTRRLFLRCPIRLVQSLRPSPKLLYPLPHLSFRGHPYHHRYGPRHRPGYGVIDRQRFASPAAEPCDDRQKSEQANRSTRRRFTSRRVWSRRLSVAFVRCLRAVYLPGFPGGNRVRPPHEPFVISLGYAAIEPVIVDVVDVGVPGPEDDRRRGSPSIASPHRHHCGHSCASS